MRPIARLDGFAIKTALLAAALLVPPLLVELALAIAPPFTAYAIYGGLCVLALFGTLGVRTSVGVVAVGLCAALACLHIVPWTSRKVFLRKFEQVHPAMTTAKLDDVLRGYAFVERTTSGALQRTYVHSRSGRFDSDWGVVHIRNGHVIDTRFYPD